jgi:hypothetical protein
LVPPPVDVVFDELLQFVGEASPPLCFDEFRDEGGQGKETWECDVCQVIVLRSCCP